MPMTKTQVVAYLAEEVGITKKQGAAALDALAGLAAKTIKKGKKRAIRRTFYPGSGMKIMARDLQNLQSVPIEGKKCYNLEIIHQKISI